MERSASRTIPGTLTPLLGPGPSLPKAGAAIWLGCSTWNIRHEEPGLPGVGCAGREVFHVEHHDGPSPDSPESRSSHPHDRAGYYLVARLPQPGCSTWNRDS